MKTGSDRAAGAGWSESDGRLFPLSPTHNSAPASIMPPSDSCCLSWACRQTALGLSQPIDSVSRHMLTPWIIICLMLPHSSHTVSPTTQILTAPNNHWLSLFVTRQLLEKVIKDKQLPLINRQHMNTEMILTNKQTNKSINVT